MQQSLLARVRVNRFFLVQIFMDFLVILTSPFHLMHIRREPLPTLSCNKVNVGHDVFLLLLFQFCDVATLAIIHKRKLAKFGYSFSEESRKI